MSPKQALTILTTLVRPRGHQQEEGSPTPMTQYIIVLKRPGLAPPRRGAVKQSRRPARPALPGRRPS